MPTGTTRVTIYRAAQLIADELRDPPSAPRLQVEIEIAWWLSKLTGTGTTPLNALRALYAGCKDILKFRVLSSPDRRPDSPLIVEHPSGSRTIVFDDAVPIPSPSPEKWTDAACTPAFEAIADRWRRIRRKEGSIGAVVTAIMAVMVEYDEVRRWFSARSILGRPEAAVVRRMRAPAKPAVHAAAEAILASGIIPMGRGSGARLIVLLAEKFPDLEQSTLRKYSNGALKRWRGGQPKS